MDNESSDGRVKQIGVVILVNEFPPLPVGGGERQAERLAGQLIKQGLNVTVITRMSSGLPALEERNGFLIRRISQSGIGKLKSLTFLIGTIFTLLKLRGTYDVLHAILSFTPAIAAVIVGRLIGVPTLIRYGNSGPYGDIMTARASLRGRAKLALFKRWTDMHIALDHHIEAELLDEGMPRDRVRIIVNGTDASKYQRSVDKQDAKAGQNLNEKIIVIFVGRLAPQKNLPNLIEAFQKALKEVPNLHLLFVGDGPERNHLNTLVDDYSINDKVTFTGNVKDVRGYLLASDIFVLSSHSEGISNALLEAMAAGLACIVTDVGGASYVLDGGSCGVLIPPMRSDVLASKIIDLAKNPSEINRLGLLALERVQSHFDIAVIGQQFQSLYASLIDKKNRPVQSSINN
jgi:glycosyltransferase involved in cell wall biosynthesis